jgi:hypothetical protein
MNKSETLSKLAPALVKAQSAMAGATKSAANPFFKSKYANLEEVIRVVKTAFGEQGLSFVQFPISGEGTAGVETIIMHESGEFISNEFLLKCSKSDPQGMGSAITYARRYGLQSACGIPSEDDDGNAASAPAPKKPAVSFLKPVGAIKLLKGANSLDELGKVWQSLPIDIQQSAEVTNTKNELKSSFTNK